MKVIVNKDGELLCTNGSTKMCRGRLRTYKMDRFKFLYCEECCKQYHLSGVDNNQLPITLVLEFK